VKIKIVFLLNFCLFLQLFVRLGVIKYIGFLWLTNKNICYNYIKSQVKIVSFKLAELGNTARTPLSALRNIMRESLTDSGPETLDFS